MLVLIAVLSTLLLVASRFWLKFWKPAKKLEWALDKTIALLRENISVPKQDLASCFDSDEALLHSWRQFTETLHQPTDFDPQTNEKIAARARSTVPAEMFFSTQAIVDSRVGAEFFKHLPGIFTGIGIIGTFSGLVMGLLQFKISDNSSEVRQSLNHLVEEVSLAFIGSASAIFLAMVATYLEKSMLNRLYGKVEQIQKLLDEAYQSGVGEEYLSRLVAASEESSSQTRILKDALVTDLKQILTDLTDRQIAASAKSAADVGSAIAETLKGPLDTIASGVSGVREDQSSAVTNLLTDVLTQFSDKLENLFGNQISGIGDMQRRTIDAMETAVGKLGELTQNMENTGTRATDAMSKRLSEAMEAAEARQQAMADAMQKMLLAFQEQANQSGQQTQQHLSTLLETLGERMNAAISKIEDLAVERDNENRVREKRHAFETEAQVGALGSWVSEISAGVENLVSAVKTMVERLDGTTGAMINGLNSGAQTLLTAANKFESSGREASASFDRMAGVSNGLQTAADSIAGAARSLDSVVGDYRAARDSVTLMLATIKETVANANRDVSMTSDVVARIEAAAQKLATAQNQADRYLDDVTEVIAESHQRFADGMRKTVAEANTAFHQQLAQATGLLSTAIQELEEALPVGRR